MAEAKREAVLVTGAAGFIGFHVARRLLTAGRRVVGIDNLNPYYDVRLKEARLNILREQPNFAFLRLDVADRDGVARLFDELRPVEVAHMAAQASVRHSLQDPHAYVDSNLVGFLNMLEGCRAARVRHFLYASSSSVYGADARMPYSEHRGADHPLNLYGATKRANELMAHAYAHLYGMPCTGLRFFTVYGPWGRPDMALFGFADKIMAGEEIELYEEGRALRDFTYVDDAAEAVALLLARPPRPNPGWSGLRPDPATSAAPARVFNVGAGEPASVADLVAILEKALGRTARKRLVPAQPGDMRATFADVDDLERETGWRPSTSLRAGVRRFVEWRRRYLGETSVDGLETGAVRA